jgi:hypothetical protein
MISAQGENVMLLSNATTQRLWQEICEGDNGFASGPFTIDAVLDHLRVPVDQRPVARLAITAFLDSVAASHNSFTRYPDGSWSFAVRH